MGVCDHKPHCMLNIHAVMVWATEPSIIHDRRALYRMLRCAQVHALQHAKTHLVLHDLSLLLARIASALRSIDATPQRLLRRQRLQDFLLDDGCVSAAASTRIATAPIGVLSAIARLPAGLAAAGVAVCSRRLRPAAH